MSVPAIDTYLHLLRSKGAKVIARLNAGAAQKEIDEYETFTRVSFPIELKYLWMQFDGATYKSPDDAFSMYPHFGYPMSVQGSRNSYSIFSDLRAERLEGFREHFPEGFIQFVEIDAGGYWVNCVPASPTYGSVYERVLNSDPMMRFSGSLSQLFEYLVEAFNLGALFVVKEKNDYADPGDIMFDIDGDELRRLGRKRFPGFSAHLEQSNYKSDWVPN